MLISHLNHLIRYQLTFSRVILVMALCYIRVGVKPFVSMSMYGELPVVILSLIILLYYLQCPFLLILSILETQFKKCQMVQAMKLTTGYKIMMTGMMLNMTY